MQDLRIAFFGTPLFATIVLDELKEAGILPSLIITAPDTPQGRSLTLTPPPVKVWAAAEGIEVLQPQTLADEDTLAPVYNSEWDLFIVASYGALVPASLLNLPKYGTLNVHPSLLPKFRGASPVRSAILADERTTGVSIMLMDEKLDHGPVVAQARIELAPEDWPPSALLLEELLAHAGGALLAETISPWVASDIRPEVQDETQATYTKKITKEMGLLDLSADPYCNLLKIRAYDGWPGTYFFHERRGKKIRVKVLDAELAEDGSLRLTRVIPEGKREMAYEDFLRGV